jgi:NNP family nitrate/nitrite transporter-like MFS transporter
MGIMKKRQKIIEKATNIKLLNFSSVHMRAFHFTWFAFFLCFFGWFAFPALSKWVIDDLGITKSQFVTTSQWAVGSTILVRLIIGWLCDKIGPRKAYSAILILGAIPVFLSAFVQNYEQLLLVRVFVGAIGASFVITQFHTSLMFAPNVVGTANATTAGWGNLGGGVTQQVMPLMLLGFAFFMPEEIAWRYAMAVPSFLMVFVGISYYK